MFDVQCSFSMGYFTTTLPFQKHYPLPHQKNPNRWMHSVIFEPQPQIQLTRSLYKVTSFLNFQPFLQGFQNVKCYLDRLWSDKRDPFYYEYLVLPLIQHIPIDPSVNNSHITDFKNS